MTWIEDTQKVLRYIEENLENDLSVEDIANFICSSPSHFQRVFGIVTGFSLIEYIRLRKLSLAGQKLREGKHKVIDVALRFGYDTPESFAKAFSKFHGITPSEAKKSSKPLRIFIPLTIELNIIGGYIMSRKLIPNVEKLYENKAENYMFPSCMRSAMWALGESKEYDFLFFAGVCGDLFTQVWGHPKWQYNSEYSINNPDAVRAAFAACGYGYEYIPEDDIKQQKAKYTQKIVESINKGVPVLTFGIVGPPVCSIIFGYDEDGEVLIGWSQFADEHIDDPDRPHDLKHLDNYFQKRGGLDNSVGLVFIGEKRIPLKMADIIRASLLDIPKYAHLPEDSRGNHQRIVFGKAAFDDWAYSLMDDDCFTEGKLDRPLDTYGSCVVQIGTNMHYMQRYLQMASDLCSDISILIYDLKNAYQQVQEALQKVIDFQGGYFFDADRNALLQKGFRIKLAELVQALGNRYMETAEIVNKYLKENDIL